MIKATGVSVANIINGTDYGIMKNNWNMHEIVNFGDMLLFFALKQCITERPSEHFPNLEGKRKPKIYEKQKYHIQSNYELNGILECFLEIMIIILMVRKALFGIFINIW